jgi:hypothetical protein
MRISQGVDIDSLDDMFSDQNLSTFEVDDVGQDIENALGVSVDDIQSSEVVLITLLIDDSGSIRSGGNEQNVIDGYNLILDGLLNSGAADDILMHTRYLNGTVLYPYSLIENVPRLDENNYAGTGRTPLYDETMRMLQIVSARVAEFADNGVPARTVSIIITDGADYGSYTHRPVDVESFMSEFMAQEMHIVWAMGIDDGSTNFEDVFTSMGIREDFILTPSDSEHAIREACQTMSQSAVSVSQSATNVQQALGGFASNLEID